MSKLSRRQALKSTGIAGATTAGVIALGAGSGRAADVEGIKIIRVSAPKEAAGNLVMAFFVVTGSDAPPVASLSENSNFKATGLTAHGMTYQGSKGVGVGIFFGGRESDAEGVAVNILQQGMSGEIKVISLKS